MPRWAVGQAISGSEGWAGVIPRCVCGMSDPPFAWQPQQTTELWNLTGTHIHLANNSVGSHSYAQVTTGLVACICCAHMPALCFRSLSALKRPAPTIAAMLAQDTTVHATKIHAGGCSGLEAAPGLPVVHETDGRVAMNPGLADPRLQLFRAGRPRRRAGCWHVNGAETCVLLIHYAIEGSVRVQRC